MANVRRVLLDIPKWFDIMFLEMLPSLSHIPEITLPALIQIYNKDHPLHRDLFKVLGTFASGMEQLREEALYIHHLKLELNIQDNNIVVYSVAWPVNTQAAA